LYYGYSKKAQEGLDAAVANCKEANDKYLKLLDKDKADVEFNWMKYSKGV
jgi:hypothetical protein